MDKPYNIPNEDPIRNIRIEPPQLCKVRKWWINLSERERQKIRDENDIGLVLDLKILTTLYEKRIQ